MIAYEYERPWRLTRALGFVCVRVVELCLAAVFPLAPCTCTLGALALDPLHEHLCPAPALDPSTDLRDFYRVAS